MGTDPSTGPETSTAFYASASGGAPRPPRPMHSPTPATRRRLSLGPCPCPFTRSPSSGSWRDGITSGTMSGGSPSELGVNRSPCGSGRGGLVQRAHPVACRDSQGDEITKPCELLLVHLQSHPAYDLVVAPPGAEPNLEPIAVRLDIHPKKRHVVAAALGQTPMKDFKGPTVLHQDVITELKLRRHSSRFETVWITVPRLSHTAAVTAEHPSAAGEPWCQREPFNVYPNGRFPSSPHQLTSNDRGTSTGRRTREDDLAPPRWGGRGRRGEVRVRGESSTMEP